MEFKNLFAGSDSDLVQAHINIVKHRIHTGATRPINQPPQEEDQHINNMMLKNIKPSEGPWSSEIVLVRKRWDHYVLCRL